MKRIFIILSVLFGAAAFNGCTAEELVSDENITAVTPSGETVDFRLETEMSKLSLDGLKLSFQEGDEIDINGFVYPVKIVEGVAMVSGVAKSADNRYYCISPAKGNFLAVTSDCNYKVPPVQFYVPDGIGKEALPLVCDLTVSEGEEPSLVFKPLMSVLRIPVKASGVEVRTIKIENNAFDPADGFTYMSGRSSINAGGALDMSSVSSTAQSPYIVLLCNDADGKGASVSGTVDFNIVVPARTYGAGFTVTITDNAHRSATYRTSGSTSVALGTVLTMQPITYSPAPSQIFSEHFDACVYGSDPIAMRAGWKGWRGFLPRQSTAAQKGKFATADYSGLERPVYYGEKATNGAATPGTDIWANWHTKATSESDAVFTMEDIDTHVMSPAFVKSRGMWDWCLSRAIEYQGYILVGKGNDLNSAFDGMTATGSPQGCVKTPALTGMSASGNVRLSFKTAKDEASSTQSLRVGCLGGGFFASFKCGTLTTHISDDGRFAFVDDISKLPSDGWQTCEAVVANAGPLTHFQFFSPDGTDKSKMSTFYLDDIYVEKADDIGDLVNLKGCVTCAGNPVAGVAVSDGYGVVKTDANGKYEIITNPAAKFVRMSVPSGYEAERTSGEVLAKYFAPIDPSATNTVDFKLKAVDQSKFTLFVMADSHVIGGGPSYTAKDDRAQFTDIFVPAAKKFIGAQTVPVYGFHCGDMTQATYWSKYSVANYLSDVKSLDIPIFHGIGNHDHGTGAENHTVWESVLGPRYYSLNIGKFHILVMDNITTSDGENGYTTTFSKEQLNWLRADVAAMPSSVSEIIICTHSPIISRNGSGYWMSESSGTEFFNILSGYKVTCMTGHDHFMSVHKGTRNGKTVVEYVHPSLAGLAWLGKLANDGSPRAAGIYRISGTVVKQSLWAFDTDSEVSYKIYNKGVNENTGVERLSENDPAGTKPSILVNFPCANSCTFSESTSGTGVTSSGTGAYDLDIRHFFETFNVSGKKLAEWQYPSKPGHVWRYTPADPDAVIYIKAMDAYGNYISKTDEGKFISTTIIKN